MRKLLIAFFVLFATAAVAPNASAQTNCPTVRQAFNVLIPKGCPTPPSQMRLDAERAKSDFRARQADDRQYEAQQRHWYGSPADDIRFGTNPTSRFGTLYGYELGRHGQYDHYNGGGAWFDGYYPNYGYHYRGPTFASGRYWIFPYKEFGSACPTPPADTQAPKGYEWKCKRGVEAYYVAYVRKGSGHVLDRVAASGTTEGAIIEMR